MEQNQDSCPLHHMVFGGRVFFLGCYCFDGFADGPDSVDDKLGVGGGEIRFGKSLGQGMPKGVFTISFVDAD